MKNSDSNNNSSGKRTSSQASTVTLSSDPPVLMEVVPLVDRVWKVAILGILFVLLFRSELTMLVKSWGTANESHGMLIPAFSLYFVYQGRDRLRKTLGKSSYCGLLVMLLSLLGYLWSIHAKIGYSRPVMMIAMIGGIVLFMGGWPIVRQVWLPVVFLIFAVKLPDRLHEQITIPMRITASAVAADILNLFPGVESSSAHVLIHGTHCGERFDLNVAEACSGMRLLRTFVALGVAMAYLEYRPIIHRLVLLLSTMPIAIFCNMMRVLLTGMVHIYIGPEYARGTLHTAMGMVMLIVAFGLYGVLAWIMSNVYVDEEKSKDVLVVKG